MNILVVGCHPDDLEIGCGGTLARYVAEGHRVCMLIVANGDKGHVVIEQDELRKIRSREAEAGAKTLGVDKIIRLNVPDLCVKATYDDTIQTLTEITRQSQPDVIITHDPDDYMEDHRQVSRIVFDASFSASVPYFAPGTEAVGIAPLYYMDTLAGIGFQPEEYVDVSAYMDLKIRALEQHASQVRWLRDHDGIDFSEFVRTVSRFRGLQCNVEYAEAFRTCRTWPRLTTKRLLP